MIAVQREWWSRVRRFLSHIFSLIVDSGHVPVCDHKNYLFVSYINLKGAHTDNTAHV